MKTTNKNHPVYSYMLDCIDGSNHGKVVESPAEKCQFVVDCFMAEYSWAINRYGVYRTFKEWLQGLPSAFNIDFTNYDILTLAVRWGSIQENASEAKKDKILLNWFNFITVKFFQLCKRNKVNF